MESCGGGCFVSILLGEPVTSNKSPCSCTKDYACGAQRGKGLGKRTIGRCRGKWRPGISLSSEARARSWLLSSSAASGSGATLAMTASQHFRLPTSKWYMMRGRVWNSCRQARHAVLCRAGAAGDWYPCAFLAWAATAVNEPSSSPQS